MGNPDPKQGPINPDNVLDARPIEQVPCGRVTCQLHMIYDFCGDPPVSASTNFSAVAEQSQEEDAADQFPLKVGCDAWKLLDYGRVEHPGYIVIVCRRPSRSIQPTLEEEKADAQQWLEIAFDVNCVQTKPVFVVRPGRMFVAEVVPDGAEIYVRAHAGQVRIGVTVMPSLTLAPK